MAIKVQSGVQLAIGIIIISVVFPIALALISSAGSTTVTLGNGTTTTLDAVVDPTVLTLFTYLLPIMAVVVIVMSFIPRGN